MMPSPPEAPQRTAAVKGMTREEMLTILRARILAQQQAAAHSVDNSSSSNTSAGQPEAPTADPVVAASSPPVTVRAASLPLPSQPETGTGESKGLPEADPRRPSLSGTWSPSSFSLSRVRAESLSSESSDIVASIRSALPRRRSQLLNSAPSSSDSGDAVDKSETNTLPPQEPPLVSSARALSSADIATEKRRISSDPYATEVEKLLARDRPSKTGASKPAQREADRQQLQQICEQRRSQPSLTATPCRPPLYCCRGGDARAAEASGDRGLAA